MGVNYFLPNPELHEMSHTEFASSTALHVAFGGVQLIWDGVLKGYRLPKDGETPDANAPTVDSIRQGGGATPTPKPATPKAPKPLIPYTPNLRPAFGAN